MKTITPVVIVSLSIVFLISTEAWGLTSAQLETDIRGATTGGPDFNVTLPSTSTTVDASTFGVSTNNSGGQNYTDFLAAINYCKTNPGCKLTVKTGTYNVGDSNSSYGNGIFYFNYLTNFTFDGQGSVFICQSKSDFVVVRYCSQVALQNYTMNWDWSITPVQSLTEVVNIDPNGAYMDLYYPYESNPAVYSLFYELDEVDGVNYDFSHQGAGIIGLDEVATNETTSLGNSTLRFYSKSSGWFPGHGVQVGQYYLLRHYSYEYPGNDIEYNDNLTYSNVTVYSTLGMGFSLIDNQYYQIIDSHLIREPGSIYHLSSASDGINNSLGYGYFKLENDELGNCGDDNINIHDGTSEGVSVTGANKLTAENTVSYKDPYFVGNLVELRQGDYSPWNWSSLVTAATSNGSSYSLTFSNNLPAGLTANSILFNHKYNSGNYIISGCYIHDGKGKGAFLHTANGTVENNQFIRNYNPGLFIASINSYSGLGSSYGEGYNPSNIIVENNIFNGNNIIRNNDVTDTYFPNDIVFVGQTSPDPIAPYPICNNIIFEYNLVENSTHASMEIASATNVVVENNTFENPCLTNDDPSIELGCIVITNSGGVVFNNNSLVVDPGVTSYKTNVYVAPSLPNIFVGPFVPQTLPAEWASYDIGSVGLGGSAAYTNGTFTVNGSGSDIWGTSDSFQFVYQPWSGDGQIVARVTGVQNTSPSPKAALMFRETLDPDACNTTLFFTPTHVSLQGRTATGGSSSTVGTSGTLSTPQWLALVRLGTTLSGYQSVDGINWTSIGTQTNFTATNIYVGLAVTSKSNSVLNTATFDHVSVNGAWQNQSIGDAGGSSQINYSNGVFTVAGSGTDIWSTNDDFQFLYQTCSGDQAVIARVTNVQNTASSAKAALMIRETTSGNSCNTTLFLSPTNGISLQGRTVTGGSSATVNHIGGLLPPQWLMLVRSSSNMNGYQSVDGTNWSWIGTQTNSIATSYYIGLAVTSKNDAATNTSTFDNVSVQSAWQSGDIGSVEVPGSTEIDNSTGTFTVSGSGSDIWGTNDAFQYVNQPLYGDGQIVAYVSVGSSYPSGKAGVMIRDTLSADSEDALLFVGTNGVSFQGRTSTDGSTSTFFNAQGVTAPCWLELGRSSNSLTASYSSNGTSWTLLGTQTVAMSTSAWVGLAVGSKDNAILNTATFDNLTVTPTP